MKQWRKLTRWLSLIVLAASHTGAVADAMDGTVLLAAVDTGDNPPCGADNICNVAVCQSDPDCPIFPAFKSLSISRFTTATLNNATADQVLSAATSLLKTDNGVGDVTCEVTLQRSGNVSVFSTGNGIINTQQDFNTIIGLSGNVKVVNAINWCGGPSPTFGIFVGCAPRPGTSQILVRTSANQEGVLWAHEYGHTQGLPDLSVANAVMNGTLSATNKRVTTGECNAFR